MSRRFIIGVEFLTGLSIGAAAAAAAVAFMTAFLVNRDLGAQSGHMATVTAFALGRSIEDDPVEQLGRVADPLVRSGSLEAAVVLDQAGRVVAASGDSGSEAPVPGESDEWYFAELPGSGLIVGVRPGMSSIASVYNVLITGLAALTAALAVLAFFTPRYLSRTVISPLREILVEADRFTSGGGIDPETAGASFHRLVELLHERERQLNEMKERAEERAERIEKRSAAILSVLGSAVLAMDSEGKLLLFNRQSRELFSLDYGDIGSEFPWQRTEAGRKLKPLLDRGGDEGVSSGEFQLAGDKGRIDRIFTVEISRSRGDEIAVLVTDVTRIGELERRIADQTAMADLGAASAGISHEMGNTLCALSGFVDLLARGHSDTRTGNILAEVRREVNSARSLINSFGSFARSPEPEACRISAGDLEAAMKDVCGGFPERCSVSVNTGEIRLNADIKLISSCLRNLVRNAVEAHPSSSIRVSVTSSGGNVIISVADSGPGLPMDCEEVFRPFRSTKDRSSGNMGLGLSVSRRIIRAMGGELSGRNRDEGGAVFEIVLPLDSS
ncbi:MAG: HAMP domain-containing histidine kinase [Candidatus Fermentibacteraceae bacterium]|nr:HAMP domain-containing histidine kinase [Candidatus Fermentibacteraceae bacterium]MBN2607632.1 HAMP domain-containing histidine kinase [Candidatus Fermentibacteraceae bacterium]